MESMEQLNHITGTCMRLYFVYIQYCLHNYWRTYSSQEWNSSPWIDSETRSNLAQWWIGDSNTTPISRTRREKCIAAEKGICLAPEPKRTWPSQSMNERVHHNAFKSQNVPVCLPVAMKRCIECSDGTKHAPMTAKTMDSVWWLQKVELSDHCESSQFTQTKRKRATTKDWNSWTDAWAIIKLSQFTRYSYSGEWIGRRNATRPLLD